MIEQECTDVLEEAFKDFPLAHGFSHKFERGQTGSISTLCQEVHTEFPIDNKCSTFEFLARAVYSVQVMSVNTTNEYTSYLSTMYDVVETQDSVTFTSKEVLSFLEITYFQ